MPILSIMMILWVTVVIFLSSCSTIYAGQAILSWEQYADPNATHIQAFYRTENGCYNFDDPIAMVPASETSMTITDLSEDEARHCFVIRAFSSVHDVQSTNSKEMAVEFLDGSVMYPDLPDSNTDGSCPDSLDAGGGGCFIRILGTVEGQRSSSRRIIAIPDRPIRPF